MAGRAAAGALGPFLPHRQVLFPAGHQQVAAANPSAPLLRRRRAPRTATVLRCPMPRSITPSGRSIADGNDAALYREYLRRFPSGMYVSIAEVEAAGALARRRQQMPATPRPLWSPEPCRCAARHRKPEPDGQEMQREIESRRLLLGQVRRRQLGRPVAQSGRALQRGDQARSRRQTPNAAGRAQGQEFPGDRLQSRSQAHGNGAAAERGKPPQRGRRGACITPNIRLRLPLSDIRPVLGRHSADCICVSASVNGRSAGSAAYSQARCAAI